MTEVLLFNPKNLEQKFMNPHKTDEINKLKEQGWLSNPLLIHMHNPVSKQDVNVLFQDKKIWEAKGFFAEPTMIYHPTDGTKTVSSEDAKRALKNGWYASPAFFPGNDVGAIRTPNVMKEAS